MRSRQCAGGDTNLEALRLKFRLLTAHAALCRDGRFVRQRRTEEATDRSRKASPLRRVIGLGRAGRTGNHETAAADEKHPGSFSNHHDLP